MSPRTPAKPQVRVTVDESSEATPAHLVYRTKVVEASIGMEENRRRVERTYTGHDGRTVKVYELTEGVKVAIAEEDWQHSGVYLGIHSVHRAPAGHNSEGAFEEFITLKQLDDIVDLLVAVRAKAQELGILTPRKLPNVRTA